MKVLMAMVALTFSLHAGAEELWYTAEEVRQDIELLYEQELISLETKESLQGQMEGARFAKSYQVKINGNVFTITAWDMVRCAITSAGAIAGCTLSTSTVLGAAIVCSNGGLAIIRACGLDKL